MAVIINKAKRLLQFIFALVFTGEIKLLWRQLKNGNLGEMTSFIETVFLYRCAKQGYGQGAIVEIGSFKGRTTIALALGSKAARREKIYAIDPLTDPQIREIFTANISQAQVADQVIPVFKRSAAARQDFNDGIRLLFIDGCHDYERVKEDIVLWKDALIEGGIIALHDYLPESSASFVVGVNKAVAEHILHSGEFVIGGCIDSIIYAAKGQSFDQLLFRKFSRIQGWRTFFQRAINKTFLK
jgi:hypothetical protein